ncbi:MAG: 3-phosphoshikimate 1-carboxyvinyltransferase [Frankia sp.]
MADGPVRAVVRVPGSKSATNRALVLAALTEGTSRLRRPLWSRDSRLMVAGLRHLGVEVTEQVVSPGRSDRPVDDPDAGADLIVTGHIAPVVAVGAQVDCGNAGTVSRFLPAVAALARGPVGFDGDPRVRERPLTPLIDALRTLGADIDGDRMPLTVTGTGRLAGGEVTIDATPSSQLVSGLLLAAPRYDAGIVLRHVGGRVPSGPHLAMTVADLRAAGAIVEVAGPPAGEPPTHRSWRVRPGRLTPLDRMIEPDLSSATAFAAAAAATGGRVVIADWPTTTEQPGRMLPELLTAMGCDCSLTPSGLEVRGPGRLRGIDVDLADHSESAPTLAALATLADSPSRLRGIAHMRLQETDRLAALSEELGRLGADVKVTADGLAITPRPLTGARLDPRGDHRLAMAYAVIGLVVPGVLVDDVATTGKTVPDFPRRWTAMLAGGPTPSGPDHDGPDRDGPDGDGPDRDGPPAVRPA